MNKQATIGAILASLSLASLPAAADTFEGAAKDAWITGKIETVYTLNPHLNPFAIDTDVENGMVHLTGVVPNDIDRDLAGELAKSIEGVVQVDNDLEVDTQRAEHADAPEVRGGRRDFGTFVDDATTTAAVKSKLIGNPNTKGLQIDVDTEGDVVTLSGRVATDEESKLAEELARNTGDVKDVRNNLVVDPS
jgi:hyperosmotically inducible periplasmic protein